ncbi:glycosyltransferase [Roseivirga seohaensis]|nr:glycosyltransferase [Roseivirga seohaensis]
MKTGYKVYFDATKTTSGQRFFRMLSELLAEQEGYNPQNPKVVLFNISASFGQILKEKIKGRRVVLRVDGLYFDDFSNGFLNSFPLPLRVLFRFAARYTFMRDKALFCANLLNQNYTSFLRILLANHLIYQSNYSREIHERFFNKNASVVINGATTKENVVRKVEQGDTIKLITINDPWRPSKRIVDMVRFVEEFNQKESRRLELTLLGFEGEIADCNKEEVLGLIDSSSFIKTLPRFKSFEGPFLEAIQEAHIAIFLGYRDSCPNVVSELMSFGLPVLYFNSGGVPEIVKDAGIGIGSDDHLQNYYTNHRFGCDFPEIEYADFKKGVEVLYKKENHFRDLVRERFERELDIQVVVDKYRKILMKEEFR